MNSILPPFKRSVKRQSALEMPLPRSPMFLLPATFVGNGALEFGVFQSVEASETITYSLNGEYPASE